MIYKYTHFIPQNSAPKDAKQLVVYDSSNKKVCAIPLGRLTPITKEKLYSFGLVSDIHLWHLEADWNPNPKFDNALTCFENKKCAMCIVCGDLTQTGFYRKVNESDTTETPYLEELQMAKYKEICDNHSIPVYELSGNHECYYNQPLTNNLDKWETYTGKGVLSYTIEQENDLFILLGQPSHSTVLSDADFNWFRELLETNQSRRCFIFVHSYIEEDSGDAKDFRENSIFEMWGTENTNTFVELLNHHKNVILFHGHSHIKFECQEMDKSANYTEKNGFKSIHIPSLSRPRDVDLTSSTTLYADDESQGYIVDVYDDCIVLNGIDFVNETPVPLGTYKIDTKLVKIESNTFTDSTGTITT